MATINATDYSEKLQNPSLYFSDPAIQHGSAVKGKIAGTLYSERGANAITFKFNDARGQVIAVRCFLRESYLQAGSDIAERYTAISAFIESAKYPGFANFQFQTNGVRHEGDWLPLLVMEWVNGMSLTSYVKRHIGDFDVLVELARNFRTLARDLKALGAAHGDLQHGNILVDAAGNLRLVDYDGMFVPALAGRYATELGEDNYKSPHRTRADDFHDQLDHFPSITIYLALVALAQAPRLLPLDSKKKLDYLLFRKKDLHDPAGSPLFACLWDLGLRAPSERLAALCAETNLRNIPDLEAFIDETGLEPPVSRLLSRPPTPCEAVMVDEATLQTVIDEHPPTLKKKTGKFAKPITAPKNPFGSLDDLTVMSEPRTPPRPLDDLDVATILTPTPFPGVRISPQNVTPTPPRGTRAITPPRGTQAVTQTRLRAATRQPPPAPQHPRVPPQAVKITPPARRARRARGGMLIAVIGVILSALAFIGIALSAVVAPPVPTLIALLPTVDVSGTQAAAIQSANTQAEQTLSVQATATSAAINAYATEAAATFIEQTARAASPTPSTAPTLSSSRTLDARQNFAAFSRTRAAMTITARTPTPPPDLTGTAINQIMVQIQQTQTALAASPTPTSTLVAVVETERPQSLSDIATAIQLTNAVRATATPRTEVTRAFVPSTPTANSNTQSRSSIATALELTDAAAPTLTPTLPPDLTGTAINQIMAQIQQTQTALAFTPSLTPTLVPTITPTRDLTGTAVMQVLADLAATQTALVASPTPIRTATRRAAQEFIYFISNGDYDNEQEDAEVYRVNPDGTGRQMLIDPLGSADVIWLSPDDRHIVVAVCPANCTDDSFDVALELYTIDGSFVTTFSPATRYNRNVRWSPDSRYIVYTTSRYTAGDADLYTDAELAIYDRQTGDTRRITNNDQGDFHATWSPDGRRLALVRCESDGDACNLHIINLIDADGEINGVLSSQVLLFQDAAYYNLRWSPDGERIYFIANRDRAGYALYYVTVATEGVTRIVNGGRSDEAGIRTFEVSPDGSRIALVSYSDADDIDTRSIYIYTIDDESLTRVPMDVSYKNYPSWSPNSRSIVFVRRSSAGRDDLYIYNTQTNALRQLTDTEPDESYPVWR